MLAILLLAAEKHKATFIAPIGIGLALFVRRLSAGPLPRGLTYRSPSCSGCTTLADRSTRPEALALRSSSTRSKVTVGLRGLISDQDRRLKLTPDWIYWVGPILGVLIAAGFYKMLVSGCLSPSFRPLQRDMLEVVRL